MKTNKQWIETIHVVLVGILMNGFIQGQTKNKLNNGVIEEAKKEFQKLLKAKDKEKIEIIESVPCKILNPEKIRENILQERKKLGLNITEKDIDFATGVGSFAFSHNNYVKEVIKWKEQQKKLINEK